MIVLFLEQIFYLNPFRQLGERLKILPESLVKNNQLKISKKRHIWGGKTLLPLTLYVLRVGLESRKVLFSNDPELCFSPSLWLLVVVWPWGHLKLSC